MQATKGENYALKTVKSLSSQYWQNVKVFFYIMCLWLVVQTSEEKVSFRFGDRVIRSVAAMFSLRGACFVPPCTSVPEARCSSTEAARRRQRNAIITLLELPANRVSRN